MAVRWSSDGRFRTIKYDAFQKFKFQSLNFKFQVSIGQGWRPAVPSRPSPGQFKFEVFTKRILESTPPPKMRKSIRRSSIDRSFDRSIGRSNANFKFEISIGQGWGPSEPFRPSEPSRPSPGQFKFEILTNKIGKKTERNENESENGFLNSQHYRDGGGPFVC